MAGKDYQIKLLLTAINNASPVIKQMIKDMNQAEKIDKKQRQNAKEYTSFWGKELDKREKAVSDHNNEIKKQRKKEQDQAILSRKKEVEYTSFWGKELDKREKSAEKAANAEISRINKINKERDRAAKNAVRQEAQRERNQRRQRLQRYTDLSHSQESARAAMMYVSAPAAANAAFAIRNAMSMEQLGIRMRTQFGKEEGMMAFEEMKTYAAQTAFRLQEAVQLLSGMKVGQKGLGIKTTEELVGKSKSIGNVLLAFASSPEGRGEIAYQLSQVAMKRKANMRQDLMVMANYGLPIFEILEKYTGKTLEQLKDTYGAELPADLVFEVLDRLSKSPQVLQAMKDRTDSLSQSWDTLKERVFFTSSAYGEVLDKQLGIKEAFKDASSVLQKMEAQMRGVKDESLNTREQVIGFTTAMVIGAPTLTFAALTFKKMFSYAAQTAGSTRALYRTLGLAGGAISAAYLYTQDWDEIIKDMNKEGFKGLLKHMGALIAGAEILTTLMMFAFPGGFLFKGLGKLGGFIAKKTIGRAGGAAILAGAGYYGGIKTREHFDSYLESLDAQVAVESIEKSTPQMTPIPGTKQAALGAAYSAGTKNPYQSQPINLDIVNNFTVDQIGNVTSSKTTVKRNTNNNPISVIWGN
jgi:hypothetical protein